MIEQSYCDSETLDHLPLVFVPEGGNGAVQPNEDDVSIVPINSREGAPPNIPYIELNDAPVASDSASVADPYNPDEPDPEHLRQSKQTWECQYSHLHRINKVTYTFGPKLIPICAT